MWLIFGKGSYINHEKYPLPTSLRIQYPKECHDIQPSSSEYSSPPVQFDLRLCPIPKYPRDGGSWL
jgi:hypothetical protein